MILHLDVEASLAATQRQNAQGATKVTEDLDRYQAVIDATRPDVLIECGTWHGGSARWFAERVEQVITIDIDHSGYRHEIPHTGRITCLTGNSADPDVAGFAAGLVRGRRVMVALDSDHRPEHVRREIELYGPLVSPGCHLVVEDGIHRWMYPPSETPGPLEAIEELLDGNPDWRRDEQIEQLHPVTMYPAGWWIRKAPA